MHPVRSLCLVALAALGPLALLPPPATATPAASARARALMARAEAWEGASLVALGRVRADATPEESAGNILAVYLDRGDDLAVRVSLVAPLGIRDRVDYFGRQGVRVIVLLDEGGSRNRRLPAPLSGAAPFAWDRMLLLDRGAGVPARAAAGPAEDGEALAADRAAFHLERGWLAAALPRAESGAPRRIAVITVAGGRELDRVVAPLGAQAPTYSTSVAWVQHGNQGLAYTDVFTGRPGAESTSGFDEILRAHEASPAIPGNFHLGALLQSAAEWSARNGDPTDFNAWLRDGVQQGWAGIVSSAYAQPIMPFLQGAMNEWAVDRHVAMDVYRYGYTPRVAWVPERVFLNPGHYPDAGVIDFSGNHWTNHGIQAVVLDDWPHCQGYDNHQIHTLAGSSLRVIPRDGNFTGLMHSGNGAGALQVLTDLANSPVGPYRIVVFADDWEQTAAVAGWQNTYPFALGTYQWMIDKCRTESAWLHTWKLADALGNPDFNGSPSMFPTYGTYGGIGDVNGYGGSNNAWYTDYAGYVPYANGGNGNGVCAGTGGNCKTHGQLWNDAHLALQSAPDNGIREAGWYVMMSNLHETGWHDYLGGPLSGWQRQYAGHIKNANVYAEAARWAGGLYASPTGAFFSDIDDDGTNELVMHNDRVFAVFESTGGRLTHLFAKGSGYAYSVIGVDNAYWYGTEADYNDGNHVAGLSDVGPNYQNDLYGMSVDLGTGNTVQATFTHSGTRKTVRLTLGQPYLDCIYRVDGGTQYIQSGWSPDLVALVWNARMDRIYAPGAAYMGRRNPDTGASAAFVLGGGGASFNYEFSGTLMKGDEIYGSNKFEFYVYAGPTSAPDGAGNVAEIAPLASALTDQLPPEAVRGTYFPATHQLALTFDEPVRWNEVVATSIAIDSDDDGAADATLDGATIVLTTSNAATLTLQLSNAVHAAIQALDHNQMRLLLEAGAVKDVAGNPVATLTNAGNVFVSYGPPTLITLDGRFAPSEWPDCTVAAPDSFDSAWNSPGQTDNEIQAVYATWDSTYLYLGLRGVVTGNSWLLYLDTDPGGPAGQTDLRAIDHWERGVQLAAPGFKADWEFGAYQHQGAFDGQSLFKLTGPTTSVAYTDSMLAAFDPNHANGLRGGSEIAVPWGVLYGLGPGRVPAGAQLGLVATLCWDPEPNGEAGGDQAPSNTGGVLPPTLNARVLVAIDQNGDGIPDTIDRTPPVLLSAVAAGSDSVITLQFSEPLTASTANQATRYTVYETANPGASLAVRSATLRTGLVTVDLLVSPMGYVNYTVVAAGLQDTSCFHNAAAQTSASFVGPAVSVEPGRRAGRRLELAPPYPNPASGPAVIEYTIPEDGAAAPVSLAVFDLGGRRLRTLVSTTQTSGVYRVRFDGRDDRGGHLAPGLYFVQISRGAQRNVRRLVLAP